MNHINRRDFLKVSAVTAAAASVSGSVDAFATTSPVGEISVWSTYGSRRHAAQPSLHWEKASSARGHRVVIDSTEQYQDLLGFGAAFTDAACFTLNRLDARVREELFHQMFHPSEMALSVSRVCVGSSDYARNAYSYSEGMDPDPEMKRFSIEHDREYILPILRQAKAVNPSMWLLASPWSPPGWMKFNGSMLGGSMRRYWLQSYAHYLDRFLSEYAAEGVRINSITPQNEVDTDQDGRMPACIWPQEYEIEFVRDHLGPRMAKSPNPADIWILDHNYNLWGRAICELEDPGARQHIKGIAWHGYVGVPESMTHVHKCYPHIDMFWTEGGPDFDTPGYETQWSHWGAEFTGILRNWARCIIAWNYALDEHGKPNIGPFNCAGLITIHSQSREITYSGQYRAMQHFSEHMPRGSRIVKSSGDLKDIHHVVARTPSGRYTAVLTNSGKQSSIVSLIAGGSSLNVSLPPDSVTTLEWS